MLISVETYSSSLTVFYSLTSEVSLVLWVHEFPPSHLPPLPPSIPLSLPLSVSCSRLSTTPSDVFYITARTDAH